MKRTDREKKTDKNQNAITRRQFVSSLSKGVVAGALAPGLLSLNKSQALAATGTGRVVRVYHAGATDGSGGKDNENLVEPAIQLMVDQGVMVLTERSSPEEAWADIIPDPTRKVAIKVNCQIRAIYTNFTVVDCIINGLIERGVDEDNIIIYDRTDNAFHYGGYVKNTGSGVKVGTVAELGGYSSTTGLYGMARLMCGQSGTYDCDYLINVPCLKALDGFAGVTLSMKNHYGTCTPEHDDIMYTIPLYNSLSQIRNKTRLIVVDAIFGQYYWNASDTYSKDHVVINNQLMFSTDPVATDYVGWQMIEALRASYGMGPATPAPSFIHNAANDGLGTDDPGMIDIADVDAESGVTTRGNPAGAAGGGCFITTKG